MYIILHVKYPLLLLYCIENWNVLNFFLESTPISYFVNVRPVEAEFFRAGRRADRHEEASSRFSEICERAQK